MYKLSRYIELVSEKDKGELKYYVVATNKNFKYYLINDIIREFLFHFKTPTTLKHVVDIYASASQVKPEDYSKLELQLHSFFNDLIKRHWIVSQDKVEPQLQHLFDPVLSLKEEFLNYQVVKILGNKKLTDVYLVRDIETKKRSVIKLLNKNKFKSEESFKNFLPHFEAEYNFLTKFNSNYINKTYGFKSYQNNPFIILKYEQGISIGKFLKTQFLSTQEKVNFVSKMLKAFATIHQNKVFHGDIHFSNVLITKNRQPRIIDFGYSNEVVDVENDLKDLRNGGVYGFIPPERAIRSLDRRFSKVNQYQSEVYQIALIIYFIFVKKFPFQAETWKAMVDEKQDFDIKTFTPFLNRRMPSLARQFIIIGLEKEPKLRFKDANDMFKQWQIIKRKL